MQLVSAKHTVFVVFPQAADVSWLELLHCVQAAHVVLAVTVQPELMYNPVPHTPQLPHCRSLVNVGATVWYVCDNMHAVTAKH